METRIIKICRLVIMAVAFVALAVFMILHVRSGLMTQTSKLYLGLYIILMVWAAVRVYTMAKELLKK